MIEKRLNVMNRFLLFVALSLLERLNLMNVGNMFLFINKIAAVSLLHRTSCVLTARISQKKIFNSLT